MVSAEIYFTTSEEIGHVAAGATIKLLLCKEPTLTGAGLLLTHLLWTDSGSEARAVFTADNRDVRKNQNKSQTNARNWDCFVKGIVHQKLKIRPLCGRPE